MWINQDTAQGNQNRHPYPEQKHHDRIPNHTTCKKCRERGRRMGHCRQSRTLTNTEDWESTVVMSIRRKDYLALYQAYSGLTCTCTNEIQVEFLLLGARFFWEL